MLQFHMCYYVHIIGCFCARHAFKLALLQVPPGYCKVLFFYRMLQHKNKAMH